MNNSFLSLANGAAVEFDKIPELPFPEFRAKLIAGVTEFNWRVIAFPVLPETQRFLVILGDAANHELKLASAVLPGRSFESLTPEAPAFHWFEREIYEKTGILPEGHPWLKPIRFENGSAAVTDYFTVEGEAEHEVAVGPIHAGVIEPGHFRFQCMGETVHSLEISLGYQHRGLEKKLTGAPSVRHLPLIETAAGDTSVASAWNYCRIIEALTGTSVPARGNALRAVLLELERIANHVGDLGALSGDAAFLPVASFCGRIRGEYLNMTAEFAGNRFGRGIVVPGGVRFDAGAERVEKLKKWLDRLRPELEQTLEMMFDTPTLLDRLEGTGTVSKESAEAVGLVGVAARASGLSCDARRDFPFGMEAPPVLKPGMGDVYSRSRIRRDELRWSLDFVRRQLDVLPEGAVQNECVPALKPGAVAVSVAEAWRGELAHVALTDGSGNFLQYKIVDPSFHNWFGLALALRNEQISNFPLCNKSFNLSYGGHDL